MGTQESSVAEELAGIRTAIDALDSELLELLNRRAALSLEVGRIKARDTGLVFKPLREREILQSLEERNTGPLPQAHLGHIWREIFSSSRALQRPQDVAYLGPEGTYSHLAGVEYLGHAVEFHPCRDVRDVFRMVYEGQCELGVVPLENSLHGTVGQSFDLFVRYPVRIQAEIFLRIRHCLLTTASSLTEVETVYSHPQALGQCGGWLRANLPCAKLIPVESTASAAQRAVTEPGTAALGNSRLATLLPPLRVLARSVEDEPGNWTRFVVIGAEAKRRFPASLPTPVPGPVPGAAGAIKTSLLLTTQDMPGALSRVLQIPARYGVNINKLESRPQRGEPWKYVFFVDMECDLEDPAYAGLVGELQEACHTFRILGCYPAGSQPETVLLDEENR